MHGEFHEVCVCRIANDLVALLQPRWLRVEGPSPARRHSAVAQGGIPPPGRRLTV